MPRWMHDHLHTAVMEWAGSVHEYNEHQREALSYDTMVSVNKKLKLGVDIEDMFNFMVEQGKAKS